MATVASFWPVQEFTYLSPASCAGTMAGERRPRVLACWERLDADYVDGAGAESFCAFMGRVAAAGRRLEALDRDRIGRVLLVGHEQFWQALRMFLEGLSDPGGRGAMPGVQNA